MARLREPRWLRTGRSATQVAELADLVRPMRMPLGAPDDLDSLLERVGHARYVLLGEASHGTSEFYTWRSQISKRLILERGFSFIAVEGDWPDCYRVNRYVKNMEGSGDSARNVLHTFDRWPTWMWANWEMVALTNWLRKHNQERPPERRVGFYGLDVYSLWDSLHAVMNYVSRDGEMLKAAEAALRCFQPFGQDAITYARATALVPRSCAAEVAGMLAELRGAAPQYDGDGREGFFDAEQNALVVKNAEQYYRTMVRADDESWNVRDRHMVETLERLMQFHGPQAKAIVWEHNTHVGDARATDMTAAGMVNVGQLVREAHRPVDVIVVGFATHHGYVIAGDYWDAPMQRMRVPAASPGSWEDVLHEADAGDYSLLLDPRAAPDILLEPRPHRAIGVVFQPGREYFGNYVPTVLPQRYDALLYIDESRALHPLHLEPHTGHDPPETYPWGV